MRGNGPVLFVILVVANAAELKTSSVVGRFQAAIRRDGLVQGVSFETVIGYSSQMKATAPKDAQMADHVHENFSRAEKGVRNLRIRYISKATEKRKGWNQVCVGIDSHRGVGCRICSRKQGRWKRR